jgi:hypothetical protein
MLQGVYIEWGKSCARALWWIEEVELLREEMHRVLQFFYLAGSVVGWTGKSAC